MMVDVPDEAVAEILGQYHSLVCSIAKGAYRSSSTLDLQDLYQVGDMAVLRAVRAYDPSSGKNIRSFVAGSVRNAIFNEAARFIGVLTVDFRTTAQASQAAKMHEKGKSDHEIAQFMSEKYGRKFDVDHVRDLRLTYELRRYNCAVNEATVLDDDTQFAIDDVLEVAVKDDLDRLLVEDRILGTVSVEELSAKIGISKKTIYERELALKNRIKRAIEDAA